MSFRFDTEKCFIISPIGRLDDPADKVRIHVERVRTELIDAALALANKTLGINLCSYRADMQAEARDIWRAVLKSILSDQLIFVVLTYDRPNVYYELGIAHSAARPVIILKDSRLQRREFDTYHLQTISYSLGEAGADGQSTDVNLPVEELANAIVETYRKGEGDVAFDTPVYDPLNKQNARLTVFNKFLDLKYPDWSRLLNQAEKSIDFVGTTLLDLSKVDNDHFLLPDGNKTIKVSLVDFISFKVLFAGLDVTVCICHEDNPSLESTLKGSRAGVDPRFHDQVKEEIDWSTRRWMAVAEAIDRHDTSMLREFSFARLREQVAEPLPQERRGTFRFVKLRHGQVKFRMTLTDQHVLATPVLYRHGRNSGGPAIRARADHAFYQAMRGELDHLLEVNQDHVMAVVGPGLSRRSG